MQLCVCVCVCVCVFESARLRVCTRGIAFQTGREGGSRGGQVWCNHGNNTLSETLHEVCVRVCVLASPVAVLWPVALCGGRCVLLEPVKNTAGLTLRRRTHTNIRFI